jgi:nucleoside-diphosphate-sugar epimerase
MFNIGCGAATSIRELWERVAQLVGVGIEPQHDAGRAGDVRHSFASIALAREQLGYSPVVNLEEGLQRTIEYYREHVRAPERLRIAV